ncbi:MAG: hypothetical protein ABSB95_01770, partial [Dissulfurispiraceae bacterium]
MNKGMANLFTPQGKRTMCFSSKNKLLYSYKAKNKCLKVVIPAVRKRESRSFVSGCPINTFGHDENFVLPSHSAFAL